MLSVNRRGRVAVGLVSVAGLAGALLGAPAATAQVGKISVDAAVQVTTNPAATRAYAAPVVAVDPHDPKVLAVADGEARSSRCGLQVSTDGGLTWTESGNPQPSSVARCVRNTNGPIASIKFGSDGALLYAFAGYKTADDLHSQIYVGRSTDLGRTFQTVEVPGLEPPYPAGIFGSPALPALALDPTQPNRVYLAFQHNYGLFSVAASAFPDGTTLNNFQRLGFVSVSDDAGRTFGQAVPLAADATVQSALVYPVVGKDGAVYVFSGQSNSPVPFGSTNAPAPPKMLLSISRDGGKTFAQKSVYTSGPPISGDTFAVLQGITTGVDLTTGDVYVAWEDMGPRAPVISFMRSSDGGATWSQPVKINDADPKRHWTFPEENPKLAVAPNGRIDVVWGDYRNDPAFVPGPNATDGFQDFYYSSSTDKGQTWSPNVRITDRSIDRRASDVWSTGVHAGPGIASLDNGVYVAWDDTRNAIGDSKVQDIYFARVRLDDTFFTSAVKKSSTDTGTKVRWGIAGAGIALAVSGLGLFLASRSGRRRSVTA